MDQVKIYGAVLNVRLIRDKVTGESRGFAFIYFATAEEAKAFLNFTKSTIIIDGVTAQLDYSREKMIGQKESSSEFKDWICPSCQGNNFARRKTCYLCQNIKPENPETCSVTQEKSIPCSVLIIRGLDPSTTEDTLFSTFSKFGSIKEIRLIKDKNTQISRGFCFMEFSSIQDATKALENSKNLKIDDRLIKVSYTHRGAAQGTDISNEAIEQAKWLSSTPSASTTSNSFSNRGLIDPILLINNERFRGALNFTYDEATGFYFDAKHNLYYEPKANYYYDYKEKVYFTWDEISQQYSRYKPPEGFELSNPIPVQTNEKPPKKKETPKPAKQPRSKKLDTQLEKWNYRIKELQPTEQPISEEQQPNQQDFEQKREEEVVQTTLPQTTLSQPQEQIASNQSICLLCQRAFSSPENLKKHEEKSQLHKDNLILAVQKQQQQLKENARIQEEKRLEKKIEREKKATSKHTPQSSEVGGLNESNVGNQLLQKMGWKEGEGIGRNATTVTTPIEVQIRPERAGLGSYDSSDYAVLPGDNFRVAVKKRAMARWEELNSERKEL